MKTLLRLFETLAVPVTSAVIDRRTSYLNEAVKATEVSKGTDASGRRFFRFRVNGPSGFFDGHPVTGTVTVFQRFSTRTDVWVCCENEPIAPLIAPAELSDVDSVFLAKLLTEGRATKIVETYGVRIEFTYTLE